MTPVMYRLLMSSMAALMLRLLVIMLLLQPHLSVKMAAGIVTIRMMITDTLNVRKVTSVLQMPAC